MTSQGWLQIAFFFAVLVALTPLLGGYMARVYRASGSRSTPRPRAGRARPSTALLAPRPARRAGLEGLRALGDRLQRASSWLALYVILRTQASSRSTRRASARRPGTSPSTPTSSFVTNTNWQFYGGETTLSYFAQMAGLAVQNFVSAAVGMAVCVAVIRGLRQPRRRRRSATSGRTSRARSLHPAAALASSARWSSSRRASSSRSAATSTCDAHRRRPDARARARPPRRIAIKQLGTNGGGFFNVNCAMPFENPTAVHELRRDALDPPDPGALTATYGRMVGNRRQGWALFAAMAAMFVVGSASSTPPSSTARRRSTRPGSQAAPATATHRRQPRGQGAALRHRAQRRVRGRHHRRLERLRQLRASSPTPASAARCRSPT